MPDAAKYIFDEGEVLPSPSLVIWAKWFEEVDRRVKSTKVGPFVVVTFFTGIDHRTEEDGPGDPILWETVVSPPLGDGPPEVQRYTSRDDSVKGHGSLVARTIEVARVKDSEVKAVVEEERKRG